ncbi:hypothetical protein D3C72_621090 [compost metagenome]
MPKGFKDAVQRWRQMSLEEKGDDLTWARFSRLEERIMRHNPRNPAEAADMLEVVIDMTDGRDDGLDSRALRAVRLLLLQQAETVSSLRAPGAA